MTTKDIGLGIGDERLICSLQQARESLASGGAEVALDFSSVRRLDTGALRAMEELTVLSEVQGVQVALRGVNVDVYKVLKLARLERGFSFLP